MLYCIRIRYQKRLDELDGDIDLAANIPDLVWCLVTHKIARCSRRSRDMVRSLAVERDAYGIGVERIDSGADSMFRSVYAACFTAL